MVSGRSSSRRIPLALRLRASQRMRLRPQRGTDEPEGPARPRVRIGKPASASKPGRARQAHGLPQGYRQTYGGIVHAPRPLGGVGDAAIHHPAAFAPCRIFLSTTLQGTSPSGRSGPAPMRPPSSASGARSTPASSSRTEGLVPCRGVAQEPRLHLRVAFLSRPIGAVAAGSAERTHRGSLAGAPILPGVPEAH